MSVSSLFRSSRFIGQLTRPIENLLVNTTSFNTSRVVQKMLVSHKNSRERLFSTYSENSLNSLSTIDSSLLSTSNFSIDSLSSWISEDKHFDMKNRHDSQLLAKSVSNNAACLSPELLAKIEEHQETGHKYLLLKNSHCSSKFIFFQKGDLSQRLCYSVYREDTGESIESEKDLRDMVKCFCFMKEDLDISWEEKSSKLANLFYINKNCIKYNLLLIRFDDKSVFAYSTLSNSLKRISQFQGTKLNLSKNIQERLQKILEERMNKYSKEDSQK